jgi:uncharacterized membrane protein YraQ (UPF0718 family)
MVEDKAGQHDLRKRVKASLVRSIRTMTGLMPIIVGTVILLSVFNTLIPRTFYLTLFRKNIMLDSIIGSVIGSISAGNPLTSYILGGEFLKNGVSISAVTAFLVAWVTVGMIQLPVEIVVLGRRFAIARNLTAFIFAILVGILTMLLVGITL